MWWKTSHKDTIDMENHPGSVGAVERVSTFFARGPTLLSISDPQSSFAVQALDHGIASDTWSGPGAHTSILCRAVFLRLVLAAALPSDSTD